jgi:hypothetical protein
MFKMQAGFQLHRLAGYCIQLLRKELFLYFIRGGMLHTEYKMQQVFGFFRVATHYTKEYLPVLQ